MFIIIIEREKIIRNIIYTYYNENKKYLKKGKNHVN